MATGLIRRSELRGIADAIRAKTGSAETYKPREMAAAINAIIVSDGRCPRSEQESMYINAVGALSWDCGAVITAQE